MVSNIYDWLRYTKQFSSERLREVSEYERQNQCLPFTAAMKAGHIELREMQEAIFEMFKLKPLDIDLSKAVVLNIPKDDMQAHKFIAVRSDLPGQPEGKFATAYICDPGEAIAVRDILRNNGFKGRLATRWISEDQFDNWMSGSSGTGGGTSSAVQELMQSLNTVESMSDEKTDVDVVTGDDTADAIVQLTNSIIQQAIDLASSDIHIQPTENGAVVKYRVDGRLKIYERIDDRSKTRRIINRIKVLAKMTVENTLTPQDGKIAFPGHDLRVSSMPANGGIESVVIRVLNSGSAKIRTLGELGFPSYAVEQVERIYNRPNGMMLVSGPTGSGKSSTLAAITSALCTEDRCLITLEEPVEYRIDGAVQINISEASGNTFPKCLRAVLRHDPDVIMVGEVRDQETAHISLQASNTGHLVFSTIHTNSAAATLSRLDDMGIASYLICDNLIGIISQSLMGKVCPHCKQEHIVTKADIKQYLLPKRFYGKKVYMPNPNGCSHCGGIGFAGRAIVFEILEITPEIKKAIHDGCTEAEIEDIARTQGFKTKLEYAYTLVEQGVTAFPEVIRCIGGMPIAAVMAGLAELDNEDAAANGTSA